MANSIADFQLALPQPYFTKYRVQDVYVPASPAFQLVLDENTSTSELSFQLHNENLQFSTLKKEKKFQQTIIQHRREHVEVPR
jgi:hypothetical protein